MIIHRYNNDGSENLDWWFGEREAIEIDTNKITITRYQKPQYTIYTMAGLKRRSTKRLAIMYFNLFGKSASREVMIIDLFRKLNIMWAQYGENTSTIKTEIDEYGFNFIDIGQLPGFVYPPKKRGRKVKFEKRHCMAIIGDYEIGRLNLTETAEKWDTNIATVSNIINGKGTYKTLFEEDI